MRSRAARSSAWPSPACWPWIRPSSFWTRPRPCSTRAAERVVVLDGGSVVLDGAPAEVLTRADELRALSLEVPFACRLSLALQKAGVPVRTCVSDDELKEELCALRSKM